MKKSMIILAGIFCVSGVQAQVKIDMKPGLWENTVNLSSQSAAKMQDAYADQMKQAMAEMKKQLAEMPPEQRKMMEEMMANSGVKMDEESLSFEDGRVSITQDGTIARSCITQAEIDKGQLREPEEGCHSTLTRIDNKRIKSSDICTGKSASTSELEIQFHSPTHYTGQGKSTQIVDGKPMEVAFTMEGKWLANDCGDVAPDR